MYFLGFDIGSSSVKVALVDGADGKCLASAFYPKQEMNITAVQSGWAEQKPEDWWNNLKLALQEVLNVSKVQTAEIKAIGISYQMHGLVLVDKEQNVLRPSIIWCDSRAAQIGKKAFEDLGAETCLSELLNSPGNFTASKLKWVKDHEPELFQRIHKIMLPGDYIAMKLTGEIKTTLSGLSEGMFWDFKNHELSKTVMQHYGFDNSLIPELTDTFGTQGQLSASAAQELGLHTDIKVTYRAGDQPNNALSLNVLRPGEIAATAGTSGVVYGVNDKIAYDPLSRINTFAHVNHSAQSKRLGILLCINGTGILNSWIHKNIGQGAISYSRMNELAAQAPIGSAGLITLPFGNGAERVLNNDEIGAQFSKINFNIHSLSHLIRSAQEGIVFSFKYGIDIMKEIGMDPKVIKAGQANMFLSPVFQQTLAGVTGATIELYNTDGSVGAARGAGVGLGYYTSFDEAFKSLEKLEIIEPNPSDQAAYAEAYGKWKEELESV